MIGATLSIIVNPRSGGWAINPKIIQESRNNILSKYFQEVGAYFRGVSAYFQGVSEYFLLETSFQNLGNRFFQEIWGQYGNRGFTMILRQHV